MQKIKSHFISAYMFALTVASVHAGYGAATTKDLSWFAVLAATGPALLFFALLFLRPTARTTANLPALTAVTAAGTFATALSGPSPLQLVYSAGFGLAGLLVYLRWYSQFDARDASVLQVGRKLVDFELEDEDGRCLTTADLIGSPTVLIFYRGNWCPLCMAQVREVAASWREIERRGAKVILVSPQPADHSRSLARRFDAPMRFLTDPGGRAAKILHIEHPGGTPTGLQALGYDSDTVLPTVVIADARNVIRYVDLTDNYRIRPEPDALLAALDEIAVAAT